MPGPMVEANLSNSCMSESCHFSNQDPKTTCLNYSLQSQKSDMSLKVLCHRQLITLVKMTGSLSIVKLQNPFQNIAHLLGWKVFSEDSKNFERPYQKLKIGKLIFHSFPHIPHLSCIYEHFWIFFVEKYFIHLVKNKLVGGHAPTGAPPLDSACFWIWDPSLTG